VRLDDRKIRHPSACHREPVLAPNRIYKPRRGLNDISVLSKSCHGRNLGLGEAVIWRMSVNGDPEKLGLPLGDRKRLLKAIAGLVGLIVHHLD
jgi:hypothetical protein